MTLGLALLLAREQREQGHGSLLAPVAVGYHCPTVGCALTCCGMLPTHCMMSPKCCGMFPL